MLIRLRMLKFSVGKGRQVMKQLCCRVLQYYATMATERAGYVLYRALVVVVVGMEIPRSRVLLGICVCCKHNQLVDIGEKLIIRTLNCSKRLTSATNRAFSVQHACGLSTTPTLLAKYPVVC